MIHILRKDGREAGIFTQEDALQSLRDGWFSDDDLYWYEGNPQWLPLRTLREQALRQKATAALTSNASQGPSEADAKAPPLNVSSVTEQGPAAPPSMQKHKVNRTAVAITSIISVAVLGGIFIWSSYNRFSAMKGTNGVTYQVDRLTGKSWMLYGTRKVLQEVEGEASQNEVQMPDEEAGKVTGNASLGHGTFSGLLYNGSAWTVTRLVVRVTAREADGTTRWVRDFSESLTIQPLTTKFMSFSVAGDRGVEDVNWAIVTAFGHKE